LISDRKRGLATLPAASWSNKRGGFFRRNRWGRSNPCSDAARENSPAIFGWEPRQSIFPSPGWDGSTLLRSRLGLVLFPNREPSHAWLTIFKRPFGTGDRRQRPKLSLFDHSCKISLQTIEN
jgi:hypothetical protein